jgi:hypothetical protein
MFLQSSFSFAKLGIASQPPEIHQDRIGKRVRASPIHYPNYLQACVIQWRGQWEGRQIRCIRRTKPRTYCLAQGKGRLLFLAAEEDTCRGRQASIIYTQGLLHLVQISPMWLSLKLLKPTVHLAVMMIKPFHSPVARQAASKVVLFHDERTSQNQCCSLTYPSPRHPYPKLLGGIACST